MSNTLLNDTVPLEEVQLESDLTYEAKPIKILETVERNTRTKTIKFCKVQWSHHTEEEATWEREENLREDHPHLFASHQALRVKQVLDKYASSTGQLINPSKCSVLFGKACSLDQRASVKRVLQIEQETFETNTLACLHLKEEWTGVNLKAYRLDWLSA
jgi:hypothetical protein